MKIFDIFGEILLVDKATEELNKVGQGAEIFGVKIDSNITKMAGFATAGVASAIAVGAGLLKLANDASDVASRINDMSAKIGISATGFQEWDYVLSQVGVDIGVLQGGMKTLNNVIDAATQGGNDQAEMFAKLGVSLVDNNGKLKSTEELFNEVVTALQGMPEGATKAAIANDLLGKSATEMNAIINGTSSALSEAKDRARELGIIMSDEAVLAGDEFGDTMADIDFTLKALSTQIGTSVMPVIQDMMVYLLNHVDDVKSWAENFVYGFNQIRIGVLVFEKTWIDMFTTILGAKDKFTLLVMEGINGVINGIVNIIGGFIDKINNAFGTTFSKPSFEAYGKSVVDGFKAGMNNGIVSDFEAMSKVIAEDIKDIENGFSNTAGNIRTNGSATADHLKGASRGVVAALTEDAKTISFVSFAMAQEAQQYAEKAYAQIARLVDSHTEKRKTAADKRAQIYKDDAKAEVEITEQAQEQILNVVTTTAAAIASVEEQSFSETSRRKNALMEEMNALWTEMSNMQRDNTVQATGNMTAIQQGMKEYQEYVKNATLDNDKLDGIAAKNRIDRVHEVAKAITEDFSEVARVGMDLSSKIDWLLADTTNLFDFIISSNKLSIEGWNDLWAKEQKNGGKGGSSGTTVTQNITVNSPTALSPQEVARQNKNASQQLTY